MKRALTITQLYPAEMNIYGDRGNVAALVRRLEWRGYQAKLDYVTPGMGYDFAQSDIIFGGGGQDRGQVRVAEDLQHHAAGLRQAADADVVMLAICGTYQLFGRSFTTVDGRTLPGIGIFGAETVGSTQRLIGNVVLDTPFGRLVGFENHSGQTKLDADQLGFGKIITGYGNDGQSGWEGARRSNAFGTYLHGSLLPKNPRFADYLIQTAIERKYGPMNLETLDDELEFQAARVAATRPQ